MIVSSDCRLMSTVRTTSSTRDSGGLRSSMMGASNAAVAQAADILEARLGDADDAAAQHGARHLRHAAGALGDAEHLECPIARSASPPLRALRSMRLRSMVTCGPDIGFLALVEQALRIDVRFAPRHEIAHKLPGAAGHGPADMAVARIEIEI